MEDYIRDRLVFSEHFESFSGRPSSGDREGDFHGTGKPTFNVGGPSIVALIHAAQLLQGTG